MMFLYFCLGWLTILSVFLPLDHGGGTEVSLFLSNAQSLSYSPSMTAGTHSKAQAEYETLVELDKQITDLQKRQEKRETLAGLIALAQLYHLRDEHWKQGGNWLALRYTDRALRKVTYKNQTVTTGAGREEEELEEEEMLDEDSIPYALLYALQVHKATIFLSLGEFNRSIEVVDKIFHELFASSSSSSSPSSTSSTVDPMLSFSSSTTEAAKHFTKQISILFLLKGDALLGQGKQQPAITMYRKSILANPCQHKAFYKLALALSSMINSKGFHQIDPEYQLLVKDIMKRSQFIISHTTLLTASKEIVLRNGTKPICTFLEDETSTSSSSSSRTSADSFDILQSYSELQEMTESLAITFTVNSLQNRLRVIQSTFQWTLFLLNDALAGGGGSGVVSDGGGGESGTTSESGTAVGTIAPHNNHTQNRHHQQQQHYLTAAWNALQQARYLDRFRLSESTTYRLEDSLQASDHIRNFFQKDYWPQHSKDFLGSTSRSPVFIVGFFRSGSTLLESLLDSHPAVWGMGEDSVFTYEMHEMEKDMMDIATRKTPSATTSTSETESKKKTESSQKNNKKDNKEEGGAGEKELNDKQLQDFHNAIRRHGNNIIRKMKQRYKDYHPHWYDDEFRRNYNLTNVNPSFAATSSSKKKGSNTGDSKGGLPVVSRLVDKMLLNYRNIALIHLVFPNALILHITRDPLDTLFSCMRHRFGDSSAFTLEFRTLVLEYIAYLEIMQHFRQVLPVITYSSSDASASGGSSTTITTTKKVSRQALVDIRYEELVANPQKVLQRIFEYMEIDASETIVNQIIHSFYGGNGSSSSSEITGSSSVSTSVSSSLASFNARPVHTASFLQVKQPIYQKSIGSWIRYADYLNQTLIPELAIHLKRLRKHRALPWDKKNSKTRMNWDLSRDFNYSRMIEGFKS